MGDKVTIDNAVIKNCICTATFSRYLAGTGSGFGTVVSKSRGVPPNSFVLVTVLCLVSDGVRSSDGMNCEIRVVCCGILPVKLVIPRDLECDPVLVLEYVLVLVLGWSFSRVSDREMDSVLVQSQWSDDALVGSGGVSGSCTIRCALYSPIKRVSWRMAMGRVSKPTRCAS